MTTDDDDGTFFVDDPNESDDAKARRREAFKRMRQITGGVFAFRAAEIQKRRQLHEQDAAKAREAQREAEAVAVAKALLSPTSDPEPYGMHRCPHVPFVNSVSV